MRAEQNGPSGILGSGQWRERLARWRRFGGSVGEFCRREQVSQASFFQWRKRLAGDVASSRDEGEPRTPAFVPVQVVAPPSMAHQVVAPPGVAHQVVALPSVAPRIEIRLGRLRLGVPTTIDEQSLRQLIRVIREEADAC